MNTQFHFFLEIIFQTFSGYLLENGHRLVRVGNCMKVLYVTKKGPHIHTT